ncbi:class I SAM-dependent methyltransferase [Desulfobulbus alkaliphilus]|uniref:class I SAM-dependent methyltransferase n=1 Tax=Desulfobulbus alkaliphilus TaxID=869814 RepID=UPI001963134E|nr:methyltransferase domain-containing protein [Desulfobulbus alkaliphilus]MBM9538342.1 methyltransferase domain-containing protein [Desulfobulbus alkaliphilus]
MKPLIKILSQNLKKNAESLSFHDSEFDYVFCKESYHHFPRPMIALYEMIRVAQKGIIFIEPNDKYIENTTLQAIFLNLKKIYKILTNKFKKHQYEESGKYIFSTSRREIEKVALGLNYKTVAFKGLNDFYFQGVENEKISKHGPLYRKINILLITSNTHCKIGFDNYKILISIIFKEKVSSLLAKELSSHGYDVVELPSNPYIEDL